MASNPIGLSCLNVFFQSSPGSFAPTPLALGGPGVTAPLHAVCADLDGDGDQNVVSANSVSGSVTVHYNQSTYPFFSGPFWLAIPGRVSSPFARRRRVAPSASRVSSFGSLAVTC